MSPSKTKVCPTCRKRKRREQFYVDRKRVDGLHTYCRECCKARAKRIYADSDKTQRARVHREWVANHRDAVAFHKAKSAYGITQEQWDALPAYCAICGSTERLRIDHSHQSGLLRGRLCDGCNKALGFMKDNPERLIAAARYLKPDIFDATYDPVEITKTTS